MNPVASPIGVPSLPTLHVIPPPLLQSYNYRQGMNNIIVLLIGGIPIAMPTVLSVTLAVGAGRMVSAEAMQSKEKKPATVP